MSRKTSFAFPLALIGFFAGLFGGIVAGLMLPADAPPALASGAPDPLHAQLQEMSESIDRLRTRVERLEMVPVLRPSPAPEPPVDPADALVATPPEPLAAAAPVADLDERIRDVVEERMESEREAREQRRAEDEMRRTTALLDRLESEMGLVPYQREKLGELLAARRKKVEALRERLRSGGEDLTEDERSRLREEIREVRDESDRRIRELLTPEQYTFYEGQREQRGGGRRGRGPGGGQIDGR